MNELWLCLLKWKKLTNMTKQKNGDLPKNRVRMEYGIYLCKFFKKSETSSMNKYEYHKSINLKCLPNKICKTL